MGRHHDYRSTVLLNIGVEGDSDGYAAYQLDLISRGIVTPSFAAVLEREFETQPARSSSSHISAVA